MKKEREYIINNAYLMKELDWEENKKRNLDPAKLTTGSGKKTSWLCPVGHHWDALNGYKDIFDNQMELDIYIPSIKTAIEYDGIFWHDEDSIPREQKKYRICKDNVIE